MNLGPENETVEYKKSTSELKEGVASIASILNKHGRGELYFGVKNNGDICGMQVSDSTLREISQTIGHSIEPRIYPIIEKLSDEGARDYVRVSFEGDDAPYACKGTFRTRVSDEDVLMSMAEVRSYVRESENRRNPWDGRVSDKTVEDVDEETLRKFVGRGQKEGRIPFAYTNAKDVLERLGLLKGDNLLNAAAVLFCPSIYTGLKMGILATHARTDILDLKQEDGIFFDLVDKGEYYIISNIRNRVDTSTGGPSPVYFEIPRAAIREALMNAFAHRDWQTAEAVVIDIYNDAVEILSPGWFVNGQDPDKHLSGESKFSISRNPLISRTLYRSGDIEAYGTGIKRIKDLCDEAGIEVEYVRTVDGTNLVFHRNDPFGRGMIANAPMHDEEDNMTNSVTNNVTSDRLSVMLSEDRDVQLIREITVDPGATAMSMAERLGLSERTVRRSLRRMQDAGIIAREGSRKTGRWIVCDANSIVSE